MHKTIHSAPVDLVLPPAATSGHTTSKVDAIPTVHPTLHNMNSATAKAATPKQLTTFTKGVPPSRLGLQE